MPSNNTGNTTGDSTGNSTGLHVGVDARSLLQRHPRGEGKTLLQLYAHMQRIAPALRITFFGDEKAADGTLPLPPGVQVRAGHLPGHRFDSWENLSLPWMAWRARCDVLHCASSAGPWWSPTPVVLTVHDLIPIVGDDGVSPALRSAFTRRLGNGLRVARDVICVSHNTRKDLLAVFPWVKTSRVIHWGATRAEPPGDTAAPGRPFFLAFGGEAPRKNTAFLLERFAAVAERLPALDLVMVGVSGARERASIEGFAHARNITGRIRLPGFVAEHELAALFGAARGLIYLSRYEGFGMPVLESIERGTPVVAAACTSIPEILQGVRGCLPLDDPAAIEAALVELGRSPATRQAWADEQAVVLQRFDWYKTARQTLAALTEAADRR